MKKWNLLCLILCIAVCCSAQYYVPMQTVAELQTEKKAFLEQNPQLQPLVEQWNNLLKEHNGDPYATLESFTGSPLPFSPSYINDVFVTTENPQAFLVGIYVTTQGADSQTQYGQVVSMYALPEKGYTKNLSTAHKADTEFPLWRMRENPAYGYSLIQTTQTPAQAQDTTMCPPVFLPAEDDQPVRTLKLSERISRKVNLKTLKMTFRHDLKNVDALVENFALEPLPGEKIENPGRHTPGKVNVVYADEQYPDNLWISAEICGATRWLKVRRPTQEEIRIHNGMTKEEIEAARQAPQRYLALSPTQQRKCANRTLLWIKPSMRRK